MDNRNLKVFGITLAICLVLGAAVLGTAAVLNGAGRAQKNETSQEDATTSQMVIVADPASGGWG